jgi:hypothetical protein
MKCRRLVPTLLGLSMIAATAPARAEVEINRFVVKGFTADVSASVADACSSTIFFVGGQETVLRDGGPATPGAAAFLSYWTFDTCAGTTTLGVGSSFEGVAFKGSFQTASLSNTFLVDTIVFPDDPLGEVTYGSQVATVSVGWTGQGTITAVHGGDLVDFGGVVLWNNRSAYQMRGADVSLDVDIDGAPVTFDSVSGSLSNVTWASVLIRLP